MGTQLDHVCVVESVVSCLDPHDEELVNLEDPERYIIIGRDQFASMCLQFWSYQQIEVMECDLTSRPTRIIRIFTYRRSLALIDACVTLRRSRL